MSEPNPLPGLLVYGAIGLAVGITFVIFQSRELRRMFPTVKDDMGDVLLSGMLVLIAAAFWPVFVVIGLLGLIAKALTSLTTRREAK